MLHICIKDQNSLIQAMPEYDEEFKGVDFQVEEFENVGNFKSWSHFSVIGCIREFQEPLSIFDSRFKLRSM